MSSIGGISSLLAFKLFLMRQITLIQLSGKMGLLGCICCICSCLFLGASRVALGATFVALLFFYLWFYLGNVGKFMKYLIVALFLWLSHLPCGILILKKVKNRGRNAMEGSFRVGMICGMLEKQSLNRTQFWE